MSIFPRTDSVERNMDLAFQFIGQILNDPALLDEIPDGATVVLLPDDDPGQTNANIDLAVDSARDGSNVYMRHIETSSRPE